MVTRWIASEYVETHTGMTPSLWQWDRQSWWVTCRGRSKGVGTGGVPLFLGTYPVLLQAVLFLVPSLALPEHKNYAQLRVRMTTLFLLLPRLYVPFTVTSGCSSFSSKLLNQKRPFHFLSPYRRVWWSIPKSPGCRNPSLFTSLWLAWNGVSTVLDRDSIK